MNTRNDTNSDEPTAHRAAREVRFQVFGWLLFIVCAFFFLAAGLRDGDVLVLFGSIVFLLACFAFLIPLLFPDRR